MDYPWNDAINKPYPVFKVTSPSSASQKLLNLQVENKFINSVHTPSPPQSPEELKY